MQGDDVPFNVPYNPFVLNTAHDPYIDSRKAIIQTFDSPETIAEREAKKKEEANAEVGFVGGVKHGWFGDFVSKMNARTYAQDDEPRFIPNDQLREWAYQELGGDYESFENAWKWSHNEEDFRRMVSINKENRHYREMQGSAGLLDNLASGFGEGVADPFNFVIPGVGGVRAISVATRVAAGMAGGVASELAKWEFSGEEPAIIESALFGAVLGGSFEFATNRAFRNDTKTALGVFADFGRQQAARTNNFLKTNRYTSPFWTNIANKASDLNRGFRFSVQGVVDKAGDTPCGQLFKQIIYSERGFRDEESAKGIHRQYATSSATVVEHVMDLRNRSQPLLNKVGDGIDDFLKVHPEVTTEDLSHEINRAVSTGNSRFTGLKTFDDIVNAYREFARDYGTDLKSAEMISGNEDPSTFYHRSWDSSKIDDFIEASEGANISQKKEKAVDDIAHNLVEGAYNDSTTQQRWRNKYQEEIVDPYEEAKQKVAEQNQKAEEKIRKAAEKPKKVAERNIISQENKRVKNKIKSGRNKINNAYNSEVKRLERRLDREATVEVNKKKRWLQKRLDKLICNRRKKLEAEDAVRVKKGETPADKKRIARERRQIRNVKMAIYSEKRNDVSKGMWNRFAERINNKYGAIFEQGQKELDDIRLQKDQELIKQVTAEHEQIIKDRIAQAYAAIDARTEAKIAKRRSIPDPPMPESFDAWLMNSARKYAYGIVDRNRSAQTRPIDSPDTNAFGNDYQKAREPWSTWYEDKNGWSVDRLQRDTFSSMRAYDTKVSVDLANNRVFGSKNFTEFQEKVVDILKEQEKFTSDMKDVDEMRKALKVVYDNLLGRTGLNSIESATISDALYEILRNLTYFTKNGMIGMMNFLETTEAIKAYGAGIVFKSMFRMVPTVKDAFDRVFKKGLNSADFHYINNHLFGQDLNVRSLWREIHAKNASRYGKNSFLTKMVSGSEWLSSNSPLSKFVNASQNSIVDEVRGQAFADLVRMAKKKRGSTIMNDPVVRDRLNITQEQWKKIKSALNSSTSLSANGKISIKQDKWDTLIMGDDETRLLLRRFGDYVANECIQRNGIIDLFMSETSRKSPWINALLYFKTFAIRSWNKRFMKTAMRVKEGDILGQAQTFFISGALGYLNFALTTLAACSGLNDEQRRNYLKRVTGEENFNRITPEVIMNHMLNGALRMNLLAAPALALNIAGINPSIKTSADVDVSSKENPLWYADPANFFTQNMPLFSVLKGGLDFGFQLHNQAWVIPNHPELSYRQKENSKNRLYRDVRSITPNVPFLRDYMLNLAFDNE